MLLNPIRSDARNFGEFSSSVQQYISDYYPSLQPYFSDNTVGQIITESQSGIAANLSLQLQRSFQETRLDFAQQRVNLATLAKNTGLRIPPVSPSVTVLDITFNVPVRGDSFASEYLPIVKSGTQFVGNGQVFEISNDVDFSESVSTQGIPNRRFRPIVDSQGSVVRYEITKRVIALNGSSKVLRQVITTSRDFYSLILPDTNVTSIDSVAILNTTNSPSTLAPSQFEDGDNKWEYVDALAVQKVFKSFGQPNEDGTLNGQWVDVEKKYTYEFTPNGRAKIIFGNGKGQLNDFSSILPSENRLNQFVRGIAGNNSLGVRVPSNSTIYVKYRVGGGNISNVPANTINSLGFSDITVNGPNGQINQDIINTASVNNPAPAIGGRDGLTTEEIRNLIAYNNPHKETATDIRDYIRIAKSIDGSFGRPDKITARVNNNKVSLSVLGVSSDGLYRKDELGALRENLRRYLAGFRMLNDFIEVESAKIIDLKLYVDILTDNSATSRELNQDIRSEILSFFSPDMVDIGKTLYIGQLTRALSSVGGIINVNGIRISAMSDSSGRAYSSDTSSTIPVLGTKSNGTITESAIDISENALSPDYNEIVQIRDSSADIIVNYKTIR